MLSLALQSSVTSIKKTQSSHTINFSGNPKDIRFGKLTALKWKLANKEERKNDGKKHVKMHCDVSFKATLRSTKPASQYSLQATIGKTRTTTCYCANTHCSSEEKDYSWAYFRDK